jgi:hydrogenase 3 maturation protease
VSDVSQITPQESKLAASLSDWLAGATRLAVLAVGSRLRGDDAAGLLTTALLRRHLHKIPAPFETLLVHGDTAPENVTGQIKSFRPSHLLIIDAADTGRDAGHMDQVDPNSLSANLSATSHSLPIKMVIDYIHHYAPCRVTIVGIQPQRVEFGQRVTPPVRQASRRLAGLLAAVLTGRS